MYSSFILLPQFVQEPASTGYGFGASATVAGLFLLPATVAITVVGQFAGVLERRIGSRGALIAGALFALAAYLLLVISRGAEVDIYLAAGLLGIGIGLSFAAMPNLIVENVRQEQTGVATGMNAVTRTLGGAFGGQVAATLLAGNLGADGLPTDHGFTLAFGMCVVALVAALGFALWCRAGAAPWRPRRPRSCAARSPASPSRWRRNDERDDGRPDRGRLHRRPAAARLGGLLDFTATSQQTRPPQPPPQRGLRDVRGVSRPRPRQPAVAVAEENADDRRRESRRARDPGDRPAQLEAERVGDPAAVRPPASTVRSCCQTLNVSVLRALEEPPARARARRGRGRRSRPGSSAAEQDPAAPELDADLDRRRRSCRAGRAASSSAGSARARR